MLCPSVLSLGSPQTTGALTLLTFDDLPSGSNGYGSFLWSGFGVLKGALRPVTEGYRTGMVSPNNVAFSFDQFDRTAFNGNSAPFNFDSAYLTAAFSLGLQVEVQGFVGTYPACDQTYSVTRRIKAAPC